MGRGGEGRGGEKGRGKGKGREDVPNMMGMWMRKKSR